MACCRWVLVKFALMLWWLYAWWRVDMSLKTPEMNELDPPLSNACLDIENGWVLMKLRLVKDTHKIKQFIPFWVKTWSVTVYPIDMVHTVKHTSKNHVPESVQSYSPTTFAPHNFSLVVVHLIYICSNPKSGFSFILIFFSHFLMLFMRRGTKYLTRNSILQ